MKSSHQVNIRLLAVVVTGVALGAAMAMGCGGSSGSTQDNTTTTTAADVKSLSTVPSVDLSQYDTSTASSGSASISANKSAHVAKDGLSTRGEGLTSRAGCESNMHKQEIYRMAQEIQMDRCMPEALEKAGIITIPTNTYAYLAVTPPADKQAQRDAKCAGIPSDHTDEIAACKAGDGGTDKNMKLRIGVVDNKLHVDTCKGDPATLITESTYGISDGTATADVVRIGDWNGKTDKSAFSLSAAGITAITDGIPTLSDTGTISAVAHIDGGFGSGVIDYGYDNATSSNNLKGFFHGGFTDPTSGAANDFTGKVFAEWNKDKGCAKFAFEGTQPPMPLKNMIPFDVQGNPTTLAQFLETLSSAMGIAITTDNYTTLLVCPNPNFNPDSPGSIPPMVAATQSGSVFSCASVTHTGVECFSITNGSNTDDFGGKDVSQTFTTIANDQSSFYTAVNAFDVSTLTGDGTIAFSDNHWDCLPGADGFASLSFADLTDAQRTAMQTSMQACSSIELKARGNQGMGGYNCGGQEVGNAVGQMKDHPPDFGDFGGDLQLQDASPCKGQVPDHMFIKPVVATSNDYCLPVDDQCREFTVVAGAVTFAPGVSFPGGVLNLTDISFLGTPATTADVTFFTDAPHVCTYDRHKPDFTAPAAPGANDFPKACKDNGLTDPKQCQQFCMDPSHACFDSHGGDGGGGPGGGGGGGPH